MLSKERIKTICVLYQQGISMSAIARQLNHPRCTIERVLSHHYFSVTGEEFLLYHDKRKLKLAALKTAFENIYVPFKYSRAELCRQLSCSEMELESMLQLYNLSHLRLQTYKHQRTLCNVPDEFYADVKKFADKNHISVRDVACRAINNYILIKEKCDE